MIVKGFASSRNYDSLYLLVSQKLESLLTFVTNHSLQMIVEGCYPGRFTSFLQLLLVFDMPFLNVQSHVN